MRLAALERDGWTLRSAEEAHRLHPGTFWIPPREQRRDLQRGMAAKLLFEIEGRNADGTVSVQGERMWVIVSERVGDAYVGILVNQPLVEPEAEVYLGPGAEIPFLPEHVSDIDQPPVDAVASHLGQAPARRWPRD